MHLTAQTELLLSISGFPEDHATLRSILGGTLWRVASAGTCREARAHLMCGSVPLVLCERELPDGNWRDILACIAETAAPPYLIVTSRVADESLWAEVLNLGGFDVIAKPFSPAEVRHVLHTAWLRTRRASSTNGARAAGAA